MLYLQSSSYQTGHTFNSHSDQSRNDHYTNKKRKRGNQEVNVYSQRLRRNAIIKNDHQQSNFVFLSVLLHLVSSKYHFWTYTSMESLPCCLIFTVNKILNCNTPPKVNCFILLKLYIPVTL